MNIAFDIDGVLTDVGKFQKIYGEQFFYRKYGTRIINENGYSICEMFDCTKKEEYEFWRRYLIYYSMKYPPRIGASEVLKKIVLDGNKIFIISSRIKCADNDLLGKLMKKIVLNWLKKNNIPYDKIFFCSINNSPIEKSMCCLNNKIDFIVEDSIENINELIKVTNVICYKNKYNSSYIPDNVITVEGFSDMYQIINGHSNGFKYLGRQDRVKLDNTALIKYYEDLREYYMNLSDSIKLKQQEKFYNKIYPFLNLMFKAKYSYEIINPELIPSEGPIIFVANHRDMIDPPLIMSAIGNRNIHLLLKAEFLQTTAAPFLKKIGCVFVQRDNRDSQIISKEEMIQIVLNGGDVLIFPEGTRNKTNQTLLDFKLGAVSIAQVTGAPIVPIAINKGFDDYHEKLTIKFGKKIFVNYNDDILVKNIELMEIIKEMYLTNTDGKKLVFK